MKNLTINVNVEDVLKVDPHIQEYLDFVKLERKVTQNTGYNSYNETKYKVGSLFKDNKPSRQHKESYFLILSVIGYRDNQQMVGFYHGINIYLDETRQMWTCTGMIQHVQNKIENKNREFVSMKGDEYLENLFSNIKNIKKEIMKTVEKEIEKIFKKKVFDK